MVFPAVILVVGVYIYPAIQTLVFSFGEVDLTTFSIGQFVGLENYRDVVTDPRYAAAFTRTIYFSVMVVGVGLVISFLISMLLNKRFFGRSVLRMVVLLPWAVPPVVSGVVWGQLFHANVGTINAILRGLGWIQQDVIWLGNPTLALHVIIVAVIWRVIPFMTLFLLAALQTIPNVLYEAAELDGAGMWQRFRRVTLPLAMPVVIPLVGIQFIWALKVFGEIFMLTAGGPAGKTVTLNYFVYEQAFKYLRVGRGAAAAYLLLLVSLVLMLIVALLGRASRTRMAGG
jgi:multiple sugar transport system permease protein